MYEEWWTGFTQKTCTRHEQKVPVTVVMKNANWAPRREGERECLRGQDHGASCVASGAAGGRQADSRGSYYRTARADERVLKAAARKETVGNLPGKPWPVAQYSVYVHHFRHFVTTQILLASLVFCRTIDLIGVENHFWTKY